ncbi:MAG: TolC family protein [Zetaproteobacteria bacterium CG12_big_fil_rev_8_21_14_0_65_54_13]|nr:MAG: transporter [Zetaproteobacteria bacterium CG23_combo_of_CG06-09_8_20_14_all_54_7]PIW46766.1 MAG: TolC family protein [Zetaproteobacteria bacterium CG12_big_fil_rev_8_21_14_0_65_54_13]PIX53448.1 MAG: TolC family protein [Zetaproteobacteria bacterium CG_4_10_14_3_um_filter_54_28]PJA29177.1 MAG: TolC family protein [Zetaproteobacteria bacterium CG_4_9_14_3_um_filter_54_145]
MHVPKPVRHLLACSIIYTIFPLSLAWGGDAVLTLAEAELMALQHNPSLSAVTRQAEAMAAVPSQAGSLPDPTLSFNMLNLPADSFSTSQEAMTQLQLGISQAIPFPGKLALKAEAAKHMAAAAMQNQQEFRLLLLRNTRIHWWNLAYLHQALSIIRHNQDLLRNLVRTAEAKYKTGKGLQQDVLLAQLELSKLLEQEMKLNSALDRERATLNSLLGREAAIAIVLPASGHTQAMQPALARTVDTPALKHWARDHRPALLAMHDHIEASDSLLALANKDYYPDFKLGAAYGFRSGTTNRQPRPDMASLMLSMTLPLYSSSKQDRAVDQRMAEKAKAEFSWQDAANQVDVEIDTAASDLHLARKQLSLFEHGILPQARQTTASMLAGYQVNKVDFLNLVRAQLSEFNFDIQYWQLVSVAHQAEARLAAAAGKERLE